MREIIEKSNSQLRFSDRDITTSDVLKKYRREVPKGRGLVFAVLPRSEEALELYLALMASENVPLFLPPDISNEALFRLTTEFRPQFVITDSAYEFDFHDYCFASTISIFQIFELRSKNISAIDSDLCLLVTTSGSTGSPKLIPQTYVNVIENCQQIIKAVNLNRNDIALISLPLSYTFGMSIVNCQLMTGAAMVASDFELLSKATLSAVINKSVTLIAGVPAHFEALLAARFFRSRYAEGVKKYLQAGGGLKEDTHQKLSKLVKDHRFSFYSMYGQAEATTRIAVLPPEKFDSNFRCVGLPLEGIEIEIVHKNVESSDRPLEGEIICKGPNICPEYVICSDDLIALKPRKNHTLYTGDLGYLNKDGHLFISGRLKRFAKLRGISFNLDDVERILNSKGIPCACTEVEGELLIFTTITVTQDLVIGIKEIMLNLNLKDFKVQSIDELPYLSSGKIDYQSLKRIS